MLLTASGLRWLALCCLTCCCAEMNYDALSETEPAGEVMLRGPQLFSGYYKQVGAGCASGACGGCCAIASAAAMRPALPCSMKGLRRC
jgi:hypothetical protein